MIVRLNTAYRQFASVPGYEYQVGIAVPFRLPEPSGLPSPEENVELDAVENNILDSLEDGAESLLVAVITTSGMREFVFYTRDRKALQRQFEELRQRTITHEIQLMIQPDKTWEIYAQLY